jgi:glycosyltransferase involved in cell wall biosynthesis
MRLTIVAPSAYPVLVPGTIPFAGGAEFQLLMLARAMRDRGHEVSFVVGDFGQPEVSVARGFTLYKCFRMFEGNRKLRFVPDMLKLRSALRRSRPEVVNQRSTSFYTGQCCYFAHQVGAAFAFSLGIDYNCYPDLQGRAAWPIPMLYRWGIRHAEMVLAQTAEQAHLMSANFARDDVQILPNFLRIPDLREPGAGKGYVLWVGSLARRKRPELALEVARLCPRLLFRIVGGPGEDPGYDLQVRREAESIPNVHWVRFVPPEEMDKQYRGAAVYLNTSVLEGLPNTFLQSWSYGVPTVSAGIDPDRVIRNHELGGVGRSAEEIADLLNSLCEDDGARRAAGRRGYDHVRENHSFEGVGLVAEQYLQRALSLRENGDAA